MSNNIENLFTQYYQILRAYALRYVQNQDAAEDIVQEIFYKLYEERQIFHNILTLQSYLYSSSSL